MLAEGGRVGGRGRAVGVALTVGQEGQVASAEDAQCHLGGYQRRRRVG